MKKTKIIIDCDNTMGLKGRDIDDGIAILYLLGREDVEILGITLTYGNGSIEEVENAHHHFVECFDLGHIPFYSRQEASTFLVDTINEYPHDVSILAIGSMTNLHEAAKKDTEFYKKVKHITIMGGICEPLYYNNQYIEELNLSCNIEAAYSVLTSNANISILNGHLGLDAFMEIELFNKLLAQKGNMFVHMKKLTENWISKMLELGHDGFVNWDTAAAILLLNPELFTDEKVMISPSLDSLSTGNLNPVSKDSTQGNYVFMPQHIKNKGLFNLHICDILTQYSQKFM